MHTRKFELPLVHTKITHRMMAGSVMSLERQGHSRGDFGSFKRLVVLVKPILNDERNRPESMRLHEPGV